ncbi:MAG: hypothetical protein KJ067_09830 [Vicinamibacteria bacterium]|nr:hypothetical protein [Vicinamibacteria bacterium]
MKNRCLACLLSAVLAAPLAAQTPNPPPPQAPRPPIAPEAQPEPGRRVKRNALPTTLQLRVVVSDQVGAGEPQKRQLDLRLAEGERFFLRTEAQNTALRPRLNADARAEILGDRAALQLTVEYAVQETGGRPGDDRSPSSFRYQWSDVVVELGKPTIVLQTSDPAAERRIAIEVTLSAVRP